MMQKSFTEKKLSLGNAFKFHPCKSHRSSSNSFCNYSSAASSNCDSEYDSGFHYDSEDADTSLLVGQALQYCEATRGQKKKQFNNAEERLQFRQQYESKKKTELCRNFEMYGSCKFGDTCSYAHGAHQLQKKTHLPSNFMTKLCTQFHRDGTCQYGERCQFLHSVYDLKTELTYAQALKEGARLTQQRNTQISGDSMADCLWANLKTGDGCGAPKKPRLACFEQIYNKDCLQENIRQIEQEDAEERASKAPVQAPVPMNNFNNFQQPMMMKLNSYSQNMNYGY